MLASFLVKIKQKTKHLLTKKIKRNIYTEKLDYNKYSKISFLSKMLKDNN